MVFSSSINPSLSPEENYFEVWRRSIFQFKWGRMGIAWHFLFLLRLKKTDNSLNFWRMKSIILNCSMWRPLNGILLCQIQIVAIIQKYVHTLRCCVTVVQGGQFFTYFILFLLQAILAWPEKTRMVLINKKRFLFYLVRKRRCYEHSSLQRYFWRGNW